MELEDRFFQEMYGFLKKDLGVRMPVAGTSVHSGGLSPYPLVSSTSKLDIVDAHTYWQHPSYLADPATGRRIGFQMPNTPAVDRPARSPVATLSRVAVAGKPFMVSEVNHPYPNEYAAEGVPLLAAYAAFHDWDAIFWYSFEHGAAETWNTPKLPGHFDMRQDPVKMTQWAAGSLLFLRGDVKAARRTVLRSYCRDEVPLSLLLPSSEQPYFSPGFPPELPLVHGSRVKALDAEPFEGFSLTPGNPLVADTGQLRWSLSREGKGSVTVNSARAQALIGHAGAGPAENLSAKLATPFAALMLVSLSDKPIEESDRLLLTAGARVANAGMEWNEKRTSVTVAGKPGMLIEPVEGAITLRSLAGAAAVEAVPLDGAGRVAGEAIAAAQVADGWELRVGQAVTPWYLIRVKR